MFTNFKTNLAILALLFGITILSSCNKDFPKAVPLYEPSNGTTPTIATLLNDPGYSILKSAVVKAGLMEQLADPSLRFTLFAADNSAITASGLSQGVIDALPASQVAALVAYNIVPQPVTLSKIPVSFPNLQYPSMFNPAPAVSPFLRLTTFLSKRGPVAWVNNIPIIAGDISAVNGIIHKVARVNAPPTAFLWDRISTDPNLSYFKAAVIRADSGTSAAAGIQGFLQNIGANFTAFVPSDAAFRTTLTGLIYQALLPVITQQLIAAGNNPSIAAALAPGIALPQATSIASTPGVFQNPALFGAISATTVKAVVAYHLLGSRSFSVNLPETATSVPTLLNTVITAHPGVTVQASFGPAGVTAATVKGAANATAASIAINPFPGGTSDQHYVNGVLHMINQVLLPQ